ncbi:MAG TPA: FAD-dependent monooxygenase [Mycobacterium sp.]|nr:FAD-dependent monooxygenase [Mycobacterium sp.]
MTKQSILIAGAGIGGLTAALTLHERGFDVTVVDRARELKPLGVGINLLPHAVRELDALGMGEELSKISVAPTAIAFFDSRGTELIREPRGIEGGYHHPQLSVHRGRLQMMLLDAVTGRIGRDVVRTGAGVTAFSQNGDAVVVDTEAGRVRADALVGADGINSVVRAALHPHHDPLLWSGVRMFRGATPHDGFLDGHTMAIVKGEGGIDLVVYPIGGGLLNWVIQLPAGTPEPLTEDAAWNKRADAGEVAALTKHWQLDWLDVSDMVNSTDVVLEYPMVDKDVLPRWGEGRVTLLGDAAHPMYPVGANGGSQAILDARVLADELDDDIDAGLRRYEDKRRTDTAAVVAANREMHRAGASRDPHELASVTTNYRRETHADRSHA